MLLAAPAPNPWWGELEARRHQFGVRTPVFWIWHPQPLGQAVEEPAEANSPQQEGGLPARGQQPRQVGHTAQVSSLEVTLQEAGRRSPRWGTS